MRKIEFIMGMPVIIEIVGEKNNKIFEKVFNYFRWVDEVFSPYKQNSEVTKLNDNRTKFKDMSIEMKIILKLCKETKRQTDGYFDSNPNGIFDPTGIVKGWAINEAAKIIKENGYRDFCIEAGGDIQTSGINSEGKKWRIGIRNPFKKNEYIKIVNLSGQGVATSGTYERGSHIYNPKGKLPHDIMSMTVIGENIYEADRFSTPCFIMGKEGINFVEEQQDLEGYMIDNKGIATMTSGFEKYTDA